MNSVAVFYGLIGAAIAGSCVLGFRFGRNSRRRTGELAIASITAAALTHLALVAIYMIAGSLGFDGKCKPILGSEYECRLIDHLGSIFTLVTIGMLPWLAAFAAAFFLASAFARGRQL